jgi:type II secretory pathway component PulJ
MFPRTALVILALLLLTIAAFVVRGAFVAQRVDYMVRCERGISRPYQHLLARMRQLSDAGQTEELRRIIVEADKRSDDISRACSEKDEDIYATHARELTR